MKKAGKIAVLLLMGAIIVLNLLTAVSNLTGRTGDFSLFPYTLLTVETGSMEPELKVGDLLIDRDVPFNQIAVGDTVTFRQGDEIVTHKLIRFEGNQAVTMGLSNNAEDKPFGAEDFLGKVVAVLPGMGYAVAVLTSPVCLVCAILVIFGLFFGKSIVLFLIDRNEGEKKKLKLGTPGTVMAFLAVCSFLLVTPTMTAAKYVYRLNGFAGFSADESYMSSNLLKKEGSPYLIEGWSGGSYGMTITVRNSENNLKYNQEGQDIDYMFVVIKMQKDGTTTYRTNYNMSVVPQPGTVDSTDLTSEEFVFEPAIAEEIKNAAEVIKLGPYHQTGDDDSIQLDSFNFLLEGDLTNPLTAGQSIRYKVYAMTPYNKGFYNVISADLTMKISSQSNFIESIRKNTTSGTAMLTYELMTGLLDGSGSRNVKVSWDNTKVYINEYEKNAYEIVHNRPAEFYHPGDTEDHEAYIILPLTSYSSVKLEFFKYNLQDENKDIVINAEIENAEEENGEE